jgi:hypothetical protein
MVKFKAWLCTLGVVAAITLLILGYIWTAGMIFVYIIGLAVLIGVVLWLREIWYTFCIYFKKKER